MPNPLFDALMAGRQSGNGELLKTLDGTVWSDKRFFELSARMARVLIDIGVEPGDRVAVQVAKSPEALALYIACIRAGAIYLPLNTAYTESELQYFVDDAEPAVLVLDPRDESVGKRLTASGGSVCLTLSDSAAGSLPDRALEASEQQTPVARSPDDLAAILYTSGTTGRSKGAMLSHANLLSNAKTLCRHWSFTQEDVLLHGLPIFHTHGLFVACHVVLLSGASMQFLPGFDTDHFIERIPGSTAIMGVPTFYTRLLADKRFNRELAGHLRVCISGSAPMLPDTHHEFESRTGQRILERYGMTETSMSCSNPYDGERVIGSVGPPLPGVEAKVCDADSGEELPRGETGVLQVRGSNVFKGYWRMPEKTAEELLDNGFFITGDLATMDERAYVTIVGRDKDLIISGGFNVYPKEVERVIDAVEGVQESAVFGVPHPDFGEAVVAVVVRTSGEAPGIDESDLLQTLEAALGKQLARYKQPKTIRFIDELPRNTMSKVQKNTLREAYDALFAEPA